VEYFLVIAVLLVIGCIVFRRVFTPSPTHRISEDLYAVRCLFVNFYVLNTHVGVVLFDTGISPRLSAWCLGGTGIASTTVTHVFLTHTDSDHAGGVRAYPQAKVYLAERELAMVDGSTARFAWSHNKPLDYFDSLSDGQVITVGSSQIKACITPGHTSGSTSYLINNRYLITGDLLRMTRNGDVAPFFRFLNLDHAKLIRSLKAILPIAERVEYILSGHTGAYKILPSEDEQPVLRGRHFR